MLQYLNILLDDTSVSFCHYSIRENEKKLIPIDVLKKGIVYAMKQNLMIQFVYPDCRLPQEYDKVINSIDHFNISPMKENADILVTELDKAISSEVPVVVRLSKDELYKKKELIIESLSCVPRLNVVITDSDSFCKDDFDKYKSFLEEISIAIERLLVSGKDIMFNLLTDRIALSQMNNCGAGETSITLAPNGNYYLCPAFYYTDEMNSIGNVESEPIIKNQQLLRLDYAPICCHCEAFQCKRCVWMNQKTTFEINTPSHEQCVIAHIERNISRTLLQRLHIHGILMDVKDIKEIDYIDPFENRNKWQ